MSHAARTTTRMNNTLTSELPRPAALCSMRLLGLRRIFRKPIGKCLYLFPGYTRWLGMPLYVTARKLGLPKYAAMMAAHTPGALFHANFWLLKPHIGLIIVAASYAIFPAIFWTGHKRSKPNVESRGAEP